MAPSARQAHSVLGCLSLAVALTAMSGCDTTTTQTKSARIDVQIARKQASFRATKLTGSTAAVKVERATAIRGEKTGAIVLEIRNSGEEAVNDLPIGVGVRSAGKDVFLNLGKRVPYFQSHLPALAPGETTTFVFSSEKPLPAGEPIARVGAAAKPPLTTVGTTPELTVSGAKATKEKDGDAIEARITNSSEIPQYDVEIYASASKGRDPVAAGATKVGEIAPGQHLTVRVPVTGTLEGAELQAFAPPTIFD